VSVITPAASVLLSRGPTSYELYAIQRSATLKFFGGFWAFPGGKLAEADAETSESAEDLHLHTRRMAACRELFEETGVLIARREDGTFPATRDFDHYRRALLNDRLTLRALFSEQRLSLCGEDFELIGEITTPAFAPIRFATTFFSAQIPPGQEPCVWPGELDHGEWISATDMVTRWRQGKAWLTPPTAMCLQALDRLPINNAPSVLGPRFEHLARGAEHPIFFAPCVQMVPLKTIALAPSTHTNAYIVGNGPRYVIDPGADERSEQERLFSILDGQPPDGVILSHHHGDHIGAAMRTAERYRVPIHAHAATAQRLEGRVRIDRLLSDGDRIELGPCPADGAPWSMEVLHTPGHASGHLAFLDSFYGLLFAGDMISTLSSMVIAPTDGNLADYLGSLRRLRALSARMLLPAHGNVSLKPTAVIDAALEHRAKREAQLVAALAEGPQPIAEMTERMYRGTPEVLMRFARAQVLAGLLKLQGEGRAQPLDAERWQAT
jgi:endoribonuclease LACTB2